MKRVGAWWMPDAEQHPKTIAQIEAGGFQTANIPRLLDFVRDFGACVDGGAHIGTWSAALAERFAKVHAFEADPETCACLEANLRDRNIANVEVFNRALGEAAGRVGVVRHMSTPSHFVRADGDDVEMVALDDMTFETLGLLKLDVEGFEARALAGARETIRKHRPTVMFEFKEPHHLRCAPSFPTPGEILSGMGYVLAESLDRKDHVWVPADAGA